MFIILKWVVGFTTTCADISKIQDKLSDIQSGNLEKLSDRIKS